MAALFAALTLSAQSSRDRLSELENAPLKDTVSKKQSKPEKEHRLLDLNIIAYAGLGYNAVSATEFNKGLKNMSREFLLNVAEIELSPVKWLALTAGADVRWDRFIPSQNYTFALAGAGNDEYTLVAANPALEERESWVRTLSVTVPLALELRLGSMRIRGGAEVLYPFESRSYAVSNYRSGTTEYKTVTRGGKLEDMPYDYFASLSFGHAGVYGKYYPQGSFITGSPFGFYTVGLVLDLR